MKIYKYICPALAAVMAFMACTKQQDPYITAGEDDYPRILNTDIPEMDGGKPSNLPTISRDAAFTFDVIVTPREYTTVSWFLNGEAYTDGVTENGRHIETYLLAGDYSVKILATTVKGKETFRNCTLKVLPLDSDPQIANDAKNTWFQIGSVKKVSGSNLAAVTKAGLLPAAETKASMAELTVLSASADAVEVEIPAGLAEGSYSLIFETSAGERFGAGLVGVHADEFVDPGVSKEKVWEGSVDINWGDANVLITADMLANVPVGASLILNYEIPDAEYHALRVTTSDWGVDIVAQIDAFHESYPDSFEIKYTEAVKAIIDEKGMLITGFGFRLTSIEAISGGAAAEATVWEGSVDINWGDANVLLQSELAGVEAGATITLHYEIPDAEYHALRVTASDWGVDIVAQIDAFHESYPDSFEINYSAEAKAIADEKGMLITGFGFRLTKVTVK